MPILLSPVCDGIRHVCYLLSTRVICQWTAWKGVHSERYMKTINGFDIHLHLGLIGETDKLSANERKAVLWLNIKVQNRNAFKAALKYFGHLK